MANGVPYEKSTKTHAPRRVSLDEASVLVLREHRRGVIRNYGWKSKAAGT